MIGGLLKYLFLSFFPLLAYLCFIVTVIFDNFVCTNNFSSNFTNSYLENINKPQMSLCPTNVFLFGQEEIISVSTTPVDTMMSLQIPYIFSHSNHFFKHCLQKKSFQNHQANLFLLNIFFLCFNNFPPHKLKSNDLKCCHYFEFF